MQRSSALPMRTALQGGEGGSWTQGVDSFLFESLSDSKLTKTNMFVRDPVHCSFVMTLLRFTSERLSLQYFSSKTEVK